jgi:hypothetical protein
MDLKFSQGNKVLKVIGNSKNSYVIPLPKKFNSWKSTFLKSFIDGLFEKGDGASECANVADHLSLAFASCFL